VVGSMALKDIKKKNLEKVLADLYKKYETAYAQLLSTIDDVDKIPIQHKIEQLEQQIQNTEHKLASLESSEKTPERRSLEISDHLYKIDFQKAFECFKHIMNLEKTGAALFLVQNYSSMGGEWFIERIRNFLKESGYFRPYSISISGEMRPDEFGLLTRLAAHFGLELEGGNWNHCAAAIVDTLCQSVRQKDIILLEIHQWNELAMQHLVLQRFIDGFWTPLVNRLPTITAYDEFKLIALITVVDEISPQCRTSPVFCTEHQFCPEKVLELPLTCWTHADIKELCSYSRRSTEEITNMVSKIYSRSKNGIPKLVYFELLDCLQQ
jgi:hypothetical protein